MPEPLGFEISVSGRDDGTVEAAYIHIRKGNIARTEEIVKDVLLADYNSRGALLGIEVLAPVKIRYISNLVEEPRRRPFRNFIKQAAPEELVEA